MPNTALAPQCLVCGQEITPGSGRLCGECLSLAWAHDWDCWEVKDSFGDKLREIAREDQERRHAITQERTA